MDVERRLLLKQRATYFQKRPGTPPKKSDLPEHDAGAVLLNAKVLP
jgi:hypothetical protein